MRRDPHPASQGAVWIARALATGVMLVAVVVLAGWLLNKPLLAGGLPGYVAVKANTAIGFALAALALWLLADSTVTPWRRRTVLGCALVVAALGTASLAEYMWRMNLGIDQLFFREPAGAPGVSHPGRMAPLTAVNFVLLGTALWMVTRPRAVTVAQLTGALIAEIGLINLIGYLFGAEAFYRLGPYVPMAVPAAAVFVALGVAVLCVRPDAGLMRTVTSDTAGGLMVRRLLLPATLVPVAIEWLGQHGQRVGLYDHAFAAALTTAASTLMLAAVIWWTARLLERVDRERQRVELLLRQANESLESRVRERTAELERANRSVRESEERFRGLFENSVVGIYRTTLDGDIQMANQALADMLGYSSVEELTQRNLEQGGFEPDYPRLQFKELMERQGSVKGLESVWKRRNGTTILVRESARTVRDKHGKTIYFEGMVENVTERKEAIEAARESEGKYGALFENSRDAIMILEPPFWKITSANQASLTMFGAAKEKDILLCGSEELSPERQADGRSSAEKATEMIQAVIREGSRLFPWTHRRMGGEEFPAQVLLNRLQVGREVALQATIRDITESKRAEELLRLESAALHAAADAVLITDRVGLIEWVNPAFTRLTGYTAEEAFGKNPGELVKSGKHTPAFFEEFWATILAGGTWHGEMVNRRKDGGIYTEDQSVTPILDASGAITHFVAIKKDISERLLLEAQFRQAQKMESVGQLASGIAHDFNNLLTVINGMSELVLEEISEDVQAHADVEEIHRAGERASRLTRQLLAFSRQQMLEPRVMKFNSAVAGAESLLRRLVGEGIDIVVVLTPDVGSVKADLGQLEQVMTNLAVNARDAMPLGGQLTIETQNFTIDEGFARRHDVAVSPGAYVLLTVSDSGVGMDEATRARIFEPFYTTKGPGKGTGLGLSTVYGIVKQSQGFIGVDSQVGRGTSFKIYLPLVAEAATVDGPGPTVVSSSGTETVLLVEDSAELRKLATRFLERAGYIVLGAGTAEEAIGLLEGREAPVHLLLSDVVMPGMSGRQLAERLAQTHPRTKVLYMSGYTSDTVVRHGVLDSRMPFLSKPFTAAGLLRKVRDALDSRA